MPAAPPKYPEYEDPTKPKASDGFLASTSGDWGITDAPKSADTTAYTTGKATPGSPTATVGTAGGTPKLSPQDFIKQWQGSHSSQEGIAPLADAMKQAGYNDVTRYMYGNVPSNNELNLGGEKYKVLGAENGPNAFWYAAGTDEGNSGGQSFDPGGQTARSDGNWMGTTAGQGTDLYNMLLKRAQQGLAIDRNDPIIRNQADAYNATQDRNRTKYLQETAERGGSNANISAEQRSSAESVGQNEAGFEATLMGRELASRRQEIESALSGMQGLLTSEQQMQLTKELADLQRAESRYQFNAGLNQNESQFTRNLGQRGYEFDSNDRYRYSPFGG